MTLRVVVSGTGNLKLIKQPVVNFPKDFDKYDPKITDKTKLTANGVEGNMVYDFLVVPRNQGKNQIPPVEFTYYDTSANAYKTLKTQAFEINVEKVTAMPRLLSMQSRRTKTFTASRWERAASTKWVECSTGAPPIG